MNETGATATIQIKHCAWINKHTYTCNDQGVFELICLFIIIIILTLIFLIIISITILLSFIIIGIIFISIITRTHCLAIKSRTRPTVSGITVQAEVNQKVLYKSHKKRAECQPKKFKIGKGKALSECE